jgi:hypothetical protein
VSVGVSNRRTVAKALVVLGFLGMGGCYTETFEKEVVIYPAKRFAYEIQLHSHTEGRGNHHDFFDFSKNEWKSVYVRMKNSDPEQPEHYAFTWAGSIAV